MCPEGPAAVGIHESAVLCPHPPPGLCLSPASTLSPGHMAFLTVAFLLVLQNGFAIIRPPGHHAEESTAM